MPSIRKLRHGALFSNFSDFLISLLFLHELSSNEKNVRHDETVRITVKCTGISCLCSSRKEVYKVRCVRVTVYPFEQI